MMSLCHEAEIGVEAQRQRKVTGRDERLDFDRFHRVFPIGAASDAADVREYRNWAAATVR